MDLAVELGTRMVLGLGAYPAPTPHTRPALLAATATTPELAEQVGYVRGSLDLPGGVEAALERRAAERGLPAVGLWAQVPHYAVAMPYPPASLALVRGMMEVGGLSLPTERLVEAADATRVRLDGLVANSTEHVELVRQLEAHVDAMQQETGGRGQISPGVTLPSGDELAEELQRFLREQGG
jgi:predicted ATP-grasp superfamily ATP-dependent carboligase